MRIYLNKCNEKAATVLPDAALFLKAHIQYFVRQPGYFQTY